MGRLVRPAFFIACRRLINRHVALQFLGAVVKELVVSCRDQGPHSVSHLVTRERPKHPCGRQKTSIGDNAGSVARGDRFGCCLYRL